MPCRCCNAIRPGEKYFNKDKGEIEINMYLKRASILIKEKYTDPLYDEESWFKEWEKAFSHHLRGCNEK